MADEMTQMSGSEIAVIGMACRFPGASNINEFWANLKNGVESISFFSDEEIATLAQEMEPGFLDNPDFVKTRGGVLKDKEFFDSSFFGYTPKEAELLDPQIRVFFECVWTALEDAGYDPGRYDGFIGLYAGAGESSYWEYLTILSGKYKNLGAHTAGHLASKDYLSTQIAYKLNLKGPCFSVHTACSTSLTAIHLACQGILNYECNMALAGGVKISYHKLIGYIYEEGMINSPDGHCRAFDAKAKGTVSGEGAGVVLLKLLENAIADGDHIYAVVKGTAINNDGWRKAGYTAPSIEGQAEVIGMAQRTAEVEPETIGYVEAHGTGTELGDPVEIEALKLAFNTDKKNFCGIGSLKTNIGHMDVAAGVGGFIKTALALYHRLIPPSLHFETPNPRIDFKNSPFYVVTQLKEWTSIGNLPLRAGVSSFGFGGTNAHVILEEYRQPETLLSKKESPMAVQTQGGAAPPEKTFDYLILLSAKSQSSLEKQTQNLIDFLRKNPHTNLTNVSYTLMMGRKHFEHRRMTVCKNVEDAVTLLSNPKSRDVRTNSLKKEEKKVVLMFSGHGSQYPNMTLDLYRHEPFFRETMDQCFHMLETKAGLNIKEALYPKEPGKKPNEVLLSGPIKFTIEYSLAKLLMKWGVQPYALIGHSFGEYTAACLSGVFSLEDALHLVVLRGKLMEETPPGMMLSVPLPEEELKNLINADISISAVNSPSNCNVSGPVGIMEKFEKELNEKGHECLRLHFPRACHSQMMVPAAAQLTEVIKKIKTNEPTIPYISGLTGDWITADEIADPLYWQKHMVETVRFSAGIKKLLQTPHIIFVQAGCDSGLPLFVGKHFEAGNANPRVNLLRNSKENVPDLHYFLGAVGALWLNGIPIDGTDYFSQEKPNRISLPTYPFEKNYYWIYETETIDLEKIRRPVTVTVSESEKKFVPPQEILRATCETGKKILGIWRDLLGHENIGMDDNFFELGGTSLAAMEVKKRIKTIFNIEIPVVKVLHYPTIRLFMENVLGIKKEEAPKDNEPPLPGNPNQDNIQEELIDVLDKF